MIDLEATQQRLEDCNRRIERLMEIYARATQSLEKLKQHRHQLRQRELMLRRKLAANPDDKITQLLLASTQRSRAITRKTCRGFMQTIVQCSDTVKITENMRRNCDRTLTEWSS